MTTISVRMDDELKQSFEAACDDMGMPMAVALTIFAKRVARERKIPFEVSAAPDPFYSESNMRALKHSMNQLVNTFHFHATNQCTKSKHLFQLG